MITRNYMEKYGAEREDFGRICIAQREKRVGSRHGCLQYCAIDG